MKKRFVFSLGTFFFLSFSFGQAAVFNVSNPAEFQSALTAAGSNGEEDTINLAAGDYNPTATLTYVPIAAENFPLTIIGSDQGSRLSGGNARRILLIDLDGVTDLQAHITLRNLSFLNGRVTGSEEGAGVHLFAGNATLTVEECVFQSNAGQYYGGGIYARSTNGAVRIINSSFSQNTSQYGAGGYFVTYFGSLEIQGNAFENNSAGSHRGGFYASAYDGTASVSANLIKGNTAATSSGGAGVEINTGSAVIFNNIVNANTANSLHGGGIFMRSSRTGIFYFYNNTVTANTTVSNGGGAFISLESNIAAHFCNNIFWGNAAGGEGDDLYAFYNSSAGNASVNLYNNNFSQFQYSARITPNQGNNLNQNPNLTGEFRLPSDSLCVDAGNNAPPNISLPPLDYAAHRRVIDGNSDGNPIVDMGALEYLPNRVEGDFNRDGSTDVSAFHHPSDQVFTDYAGNLGQYGWGGADCMPVVWDYDGDGQTDVSIYHLPTNQWFVRGYPGDNLGQFGFGQEESIPVPGDYNGDGIMERAFYHWPTNRWFVEGAADPIEFGWGGAECVPFAGDYDGDGVADMVLYHLPTNQWFVYGVGNLGQMAGEGQTAFRCPGIGTGTGGRRLRCIIRRTTSGSGGTGMRSRHNSGAVRLGRIGKFSDSGGL